MIFYERWAVYSLLPNEATFVSDCTPKTQVIVSVAAAGSPMAGLAASYAAASAP